MHAAALLAVSIVLAGPPTGAPMKDFSNGPAILHITSDQWMTMVLVDGTPLQEGDCTSPKACDVVDLAPGPHELDIRHGAFANKTIFKGMVHVTGGAEIWGKAKDNQFTIYNTQARKDLPPPTTAVAVAPSTGATQVTTTTVTTGTAPHQGGGVGLNMTVVDPHTGETVNMGVSAGMFGATSSTTVTESTTTTTTVGGAPAPAPAVSGAKGTIELTSQDGESFTVFLDGKKVGTFNGLEGQSIRVKNVAAGEHKLVIKSFMEDATWTSGRVWMDPGFTLKLGVDENEGVESFNQASAWQPRR